MTTIGVTRGAAPAAAERDRWWLVAAVGLIVFMAQLDASIVTVALPAIEHHYGVRTSASEWIVLGYLLPVIAMVLPSGRWLDRVDKRSMLVASTAGFALTSVLAGAAPTVWWLVGARVAQGVCGAVLLALTPALSTVAVRPEARGRAMGVVTTLGPLGAVSGPVVGGVLVDSWGWPWIFYVNVPVSVLVIGLGLQQMNREGRLRLPDRSWALESGLLIASTVALFLGLSLTATHGLSWALLTLLAVPPLLGWRRLATSRAVRDLVVMPGMPGPHYALLGVFAGVGFVQFVAPFYLQDVLNASPSLTGMTVLSFPVAMAVFGAVSGVLTDRHGARRVAVVGTVLTSAGLVLLVPLGAAWSISDLLWRLFVVGAGIGLFNAAAMTMLMSTSPKHLLGTTSGSTSLARQLGLAVGPALATALWAVSEYTIVGMRAAVAMAATFGVTSLFALLQTPAVTLPTPHAGLRGSKRHKWWNEDAVRLAGGDTSVAAPRGVVPLTMLVAGVLTLGIATAVLRSDDADDRSARNDDPGSGFVSESPTPEPTDTPTVEPTSPAPSPTVTTSPGTGAGSPGTGTESPGTGAGSPGPGQPADPDAPQMPETGSGELLPVAALVALGSAYGARAVRRRQPRP